MAEDPIYRGWDVRGRLGRALKRTAASAKRSREARDAASLAERVTAELRESGFDEPAGRKRLAERMAARILAHLVPDCADAETLPFFPPLSTCCRALIEQEGFFALPDGSASDDPPVRSAIWVAEDALRRTEKILDNLDDAIGDLAAMMASAVAPILERCPALAVHPAGRDGDLRFHTPLAASLDGLPEILDGMVQLPFAPELDTYETTTHLRERLEYNLIVAAGGVPGVTEVREKSLRLPSKAPAMGTDGLIRTYLDGTPFAHLFECAVPLSIPTETRFEHHHIVAGSGHGKTQTLQHLILHDLDAVADGTASVVVIDSQSDLIENIAGLSVFAPGGSLEGRLCVIDPTDVEWPVALNLFDVGMERIDRYSQLDRERLINGILELYDFVLGSLLDAGMTQKQSVIFRYITRLLLHIPEATIHTFRELLEDDGYERYEPYIRELEGSARAFFETEFQSREFVQTKKQVLRRLYGILENRTFERMFTHPKSKFDLFAEMNAGKVILINTAKDLLKENGTEIFGRFFIAMIAQAAQERAALSREARLPTYVYIDEANDYFDRNIGIILSQARKYRVGMVLAHQYLGQLDGKLQEAMFANTAIKFAGGVSAKDARALAAELRTEAGQIEDQEKLSFAAFVKGATRNAVTISLEPGEMESLPRMSAGDRCGLRAVMRERYAVHYTEAKAQAARHEAERSEELNTDPGTHEPMPWK